MGRPAIKLYLDTSVISHLKQEDVPDKMEDTLALWADIKRGVYDAYISETTLAEIIKTPEPKRSFMLDSLEQIKYTVLKFGKDIEAYTNEMNRIGILSANQIDDCFHIAYAVVNGCDMIVSWNFKHIVKVKTINGVRWLNSVLGYADIGIYSPSMIL